MKLSNFEIVEIVGTSITNAIYYAEVDVTRTKGILWWKTSETTRETIAKEYALYWKDVDTGKSISHTNADELCDAWCMKHKVTFKDIGAIRNIINGAK